MGPVAGGRVLGVVAVVERDDVVERVDRAFGAGAGVALAFPGGGGVDRLLQFDTGGVGEDPA